MRPHAPSHVFFASLLGLILATPVLAKPILFPPTPDGRQEVREETNVAPFLAAWKAAAFKHARLAAAEVTANQQQYDVKWYDLNLTFTPATSNVSGTVRMKATVVSGPISTVDLDFYSNLVLDGATSGGVAATSSRAGNVLSLNLDHAYNIGQTVDVTVTYHGNPTAAGYLFFQTVNGRQLIWSLSEAYGSRTWWPCKDAPEDKADSVDIHFTAPVALTTASNGTQVSRVVNGSVATTNWHERYPIATYLVSIASYPYTVTTDWYRPTPTDSMLIRFHNYPEDAAAVAPVQAKVKDMIAAFASRFGEYPFIAEKYGHAQFQFGGGEEHQTCTSLGSFLEFVVAHELTHQWWGDLVTCRDFHHIWLNEGFATYGEALWAEATGGSAAYHASIEQYRYLGPGSVWVPDATDENRIFDAHLSYAKGGWVLHMLRHVLGDATFFNALRQYHTTWGYKSAVTEDFRDVCESVSGRNLHPFFQQWIYGEYYPIYDSMWSATPAGGGYDVTLTLQQTQTWQLFTMPVDITVSTSSGDVTFVVPDSLASQTFVLHVNGTPNGLQIDKDNWILKSIQSVVSNPTFERKLLLVNGVDWSNYGTEITSAYTDHAFTGAYPFDFWDNFPAPSGGYPSGLPAPRGHGAVPADTIQHYRNVIWVGNDFHGDLALWHDTPILSYLNAGGNVLLMARYGNLFLDVALQSYLGVTWTNTSATLFDCLPTRPGFSSMSLLSTQSLCAAFDTVLATPESQLLFRVSTNYSPSRGIGAIRSPVNGAGVRPRGGRLAFISGRPYRWNHTSLQNNITTILGSYFFEPVSNVGVDPTGVITPLGLAPPRPNPFSDATALHFTLARTGEAHLVVLDVAGRRVKTLANGVLALGPHDVTWDGRDDRGSLAPAGLYWARLECGGESVVRRLVRMR